MEKGRNISTSEASIQTVFVEIKVLTINNKQMTLAVFRQLPEQEVQETDVHWGLVRYTIAEKDLWLVFSRECKLYRAEVPSLSWVDKERLRREELQLQGCQRELDFMAKGKISSLERPRIESQLYNSRERLAELLNKKQRIEARRAFLEETLPQLFIAV